MNLARAHGAFLTSLRLGKHAGGWHQKGRTRPMKRRRFALAATHPKASTYIQLDARVRQLMLAGHSSPSRTARKELA